MNDNPFPSIQGPVCPVPLQHKEKIVLGHGSGGKMMNDLIRDIFLPPLDNPILRIGDDAGVVSPNGNTFFSISTDAHVVSPLFFPGGDIGKLAVCGTVNDVAMMGAKPLYLTASFILEEGLEIETLINIVNSMKEVADEADVQIIAGDTKVVERGKADGIYISTSGIGNVYPMVSISGNQAKPGDHIILSGTIGDHGIAVLGARGELGFTSNIQSDVAPLNHLIETMLNTSKEIHVLRDPTRGGVASVLNEIANQSNVGIFIDEESIPVNPSVQAACEMLGFDPLYIANEGKLVAFVSERDSQKVLETMHQTKYGENAVIIGKVEQKPVKRVLMNTLIGSTRVVDILSGELLPRIC
jgi:hydrogenase expression/formation protein HypE